MASPASSQTDSPYQLTPPLSPPTLSSSPPAERPKPRFACLTSPLPTEELDDYRPGGYHPVHLGELLYHRRYQIIRKLGFGEFSTVWLARDLSSSRIVAVKVKMAENSIKNSELPILCYLHQKTGAGAAHVISLLDCFALKGPNGSHICLVTEALGPSLSDMLESTPEYRTGARSGFSSSRFPLWMVKRILRHVLLGIAYLHSHDIIHGDIRDSNLLFVVPNLDVANTDDLAIMDQLAIDEAPWNNSLKRLDGKLNKSAPRYIPISYPLFREANRGSDFIVKISDLGSACRFGHRSRHPVTPDSLRAPELVFKAPFDQSIDIWSFGCLLYQLVTGKPLFISMHWPQSPDRRDKIDDTHLLDMIDRLGPLPPQLLSQWPRSHKYLRTNGEIFSSTVGESYEAVTRPDPIEAAFQRQKPIELDDKEGYVILDLLRYVLEYEPAQRPSAVDILNHPWFREFAS